MLQGEYEFGTAGCTEFTIELDIISTFKPLEFDGLRYDLPASAQVEAQVEAQVFRKCPKQPSLSGDIARALRHKTLSGKLQKYKITESLAGID
jgi:hypothetical protein